MLEGGHTAHSTFQIPLQLDEASTCKICPGSKMHQVIAQTAIVIWDEVPMQYKFAVDAVDHTFHDLMHKNVPFGGITVLFGGDFHQTLPVIPKGICQQIIGASLPWSSLWRCIVVHKLDKNMRLEETANSQEYAQWLLKIGEGKTINAQEQIAILDHMICTENTINNLIAFTYPDIKNHGHNN